MATIDREITDLLYRLPIFEQRRVLEFARQLAELKPQGVPGEDLIVFGGRIPEDHLRRMQAAFEEGCENISSF